jgi:hypothetical protein
MPSSGSSAERESMSRDSTRASMRIATRPLWRMRLARALPRFLLYGLCTAGLAASARFAIDPPRAPVPATSPSPSASPDLAAQGFATLFARRYLTWSADDAEAGQRPLASFAGPGLDADAGLRLPAEGEQHVESAEVVQARQLAPGEHVYTVAAQTDTAGLLYLTVGVVREADGALALTGYPAFVGPPASGSARAPARTREVTDSALVTVVGRALRNYLAASQEELAADLARSARISLPSLALALTSVERLSWSSAGRSVRAVIQARDGRGVFYTLDYEIDVVAVAGRWEIAAIQMDPDV